jgi:hypothetical protein
MRKQVASSVHILPGNEGQVLEFFEDVYITRTEEFAESMNKWQMHEREFFQPSSQGNPFEVALKESDHEEVVIGLEQDDDDVAPWFV